MTVPDDGNASAEDRIVASAMALIEEQGLAAVTISEVAKGAGVARQTVYNHFDDVDAIVLAILGRQDVMDGPRVGALLDTAETPTEKIDLYVRHAIATQDLVGSAMALRSSLGPEAREQLDAHRAAAGETLIAIVADGVREGSLAAGLDAEIGAAMISGVLAGLGDIPSVRPRSEVTAQTVAAVLRLLGADETG
jgi:AcrR family transcriptional regulator